MDWVRVLPASLGRWIKSCWRGTNIWPRKTAILKAQLRGRPKLSDAEPATLGEMGHRLGRKALDQTRRQLAEERQCLLASELPSDDDLALGIDAVDLERLLCKGRSSPMPQCPRRGRNCGEAGYSPGLVPQACRQLRGGPQFGARRKGPPTAQPVVSCRARYWTAKFPMCRICSQTQQFRWLESPSQPGQTADHARGRAAHRSHSRAEPLLGL